MLNDKKKLFSTSAVYINLLCNTCLRNGSIKACMVHLVVKLLLCAVKLE